MNKQVRDFADAIFKEFESDVRDAHPRRIQDQFSRLFTEVDTAITKVEGFHAVGRIFQFGAQYIREDARYEKYRNMYHHLHDLVEQAHDEDFDDV